MTHDRRVEVLGALGGASLLETASYLVLLVAVLVQALGGADVTRAAGLGHGIVYLSYAALVLAGRTAMRWNAQQTAQALIVAAVPLGALAVHREVERRRRDRRRTTAGRPGPGTRPDGSPRV